MAEADSSLSQRVESLERISHERVVEQVTELGERVTGLESSRETEQPHLATKSDVARLDGQLAQLDAKIDAQSEQLNAKIDAQSEQLNAKIDAQSDQLRGEMVTQTEQLRTRMEQRMNQLVVWLVGTGIAIGALILSRLPG